MLVDDAEQSAAAAVTGAIGATVRPATFTRWSGFYVGGALSFGNATSDFSKTTTPLFDFSLRGLALASALSPSEKVVLRGRRGGTGKLQRDLACLWPTEYPEPAFPKSRRIMYR
jgi:hypothetical protein